MMLTVKAVKRDNKPVTVSMNRTRDITQKDIDNFTKKCDNSISDLYNSCALKSMSIHLKVINNNGNTIENINQNLSNLSDLQAQITNCLMIANYCFSMRR